MKTAVEHVFTGVTASLSGSYDSTKTMLGTLLRQFSGSLSTEKYVSANPPVLVNLPEQSGFSFYSPHVYKWSNNIYWIFTPTNATAAVTRNIGLFEYNYSANTITWKGYITLSGTTIAGVKTIRSMRSHVTKHITGTVSTSGLSTTVTGVGTDFQTAGIAVGARIGFGTTDPTAVTTWYEITAIASDTSLTLNTAANISSGAYVIEEIRISIACTNATLYNGGVHLIKGLNYGTFSSGGTTIVEATSTDNLRASYLLRDKANQTFTVAVATPATFTAVGHGFVAGDLVSFSTTGTLTGPTINTTFYVIATGLTADAFQVSATLGGAAIACTVQSGTHTVYSGNLNIGMGMGVDETTISDTNVDIYFLNSDNATTVRITKFNIRAALTVSGGISVSAFTLKTLGMTTVGTVQQVGNGRIFSVAHGAASGIKSLYFVTATRVYRSAVADITSNSSSWLSDFMLENPPGTITTNLATNAMVQVDYSSTLDRLLISTTLAGKHGTYVAKYDTASPQFEKLFGQISNRTKLTTTSAGASDGLFSPAALTMWTEDGMLFTIPNITTSGLNWLTVIPIGVDAYYANNTNQKIITPKLPTLNASQLYRVYIQTDQYTGDFNLGYTPEPIRLYYRTSGIDDNSGAWTEVISGDLSGVTPGDYIQFMIYIDILGELCIPRKVFSICLIFEDSSQDSHYEPSLTLSSAQNRIFAWSQITSWGSNIPNLRLQLFNVANGYSVLDDNVTSSSDGVWQYSTDGTNWLTWDATQDTIGNYIKYTATTLPNNITVRALLTQL